MQYQAHFDTSHVQVLFVFSLFLASQSTQGDGGSGRKAALEDLSISKDFFGQCNFPASLPDLTH